MNRSEILKKAEEIIRMYAEDPQDALMYLQAKHPFLNISKEDYSGYCDANDPVFDLLLGFDSLAVAFVSLNDIKKLYLEAKAFAPS